MAEVTASVHHLSVASGPPGSSSCIFQNCPEGLSPEAGPCPGPSPFPPDLVGSSFSWPISWVARMASEFHSTTYHHPPPALPSSPCPAYLSPTQGGTSGCSEMWGQCRDRPKFPGSQHGAQDCPARQAPCSHRGACLPPSPPPPQGPSLLLPLLHSPSPRSPHFPPAPALV